MSLKGTIRFVLEPDYNQEEVNPKDVVPSSDYSFILITLKVCRLL